MARARRRRAQLRGLRRRRQMPVAALAVRAVTTDAGSPVAAEVVRSAAANAECNEAEWCRHAGGGSGCGSGRSSDSPQEQADAEHSEQNEAHVCFWYVHDVEHVIEHVICDVDAIAFALAL